MRLREAETGTGGGDDDHAGLVAVFGGRSALDDFHRLDGSRAGSDSRNTLLCWSVMGWPSTENEFDA